MSPRTAGALGLFVICAAVAPGLQARVARTMEAQQRLYKGAELLTRGHTEEAERLWQEAARLAPRNPNVHRTLGALYLSQGRLADARATLNRLADVAPREPHSLCELAEREYESGSLSLLSAAAEDA